jgi:hypothetical protein
MKQQTGNTNMTTDVTKSSASANAIAALGNLKQGLQNVQSGIRVAGGDPILRMGRDGVWIYGADNVEVEDGSEWAINPMSLQHGFICWKDIPQGSKDKPELLGEEVRSMFQPLPVKEALPDYGPANKWVEEILVDIKCISGEDEGEQVIYKPSSTGGMRAMKEVIGAIMEAIDKHPDTPVPVITLGNDSYQHKQYGKTYVPQLQIVRWIGMDGVAPETPAEEKKQAEAQVSKTKQAVPAAAADQVEDDEAEDEVTQVAETPADTGERRRRRRAA